MKVINRTRRTGSTNQQMSVGSQWSALPARSTCKHSTRLACQCLGAACAPATYALFSISRRVRPFTSASYHCLLSREKNASGTLCEWFSCAQRCTCLPTSYDGNALTEWFFLSSPQGRQRNILNDRKHLGYVWDTLVWLFLQRSVYFL